MRMEEANLLNEQSSDGSFHLLADSFSLRVVFSIRSFRVVRVLAVSLNVHVGHA